MPLRKHHWVGLFLLLVLLYSPVLWVHPTLQYDDVELLKPLSQIESLSDYSGAVANHQILDRQPVRDFSYWLELKFENATGYRNSQLVNLFIWFLILGLSFQILETLYPGSPWNGWLICLLALHPVAASSVAWTSARKHLLSALFILLCTWLALLRSQKQKFKYDFLILVFFVLSIFSQPINLAWPLWLVSFFHQRKELRNRKNTALLLSLFLVCAACAYLNFIYYTGESFSKAALDSPPKINDESWLNIWSRFLVLGRYTWQMFFPVQTAGMPYGLWQASSGIGLTVLVGFGAVLWKWHQRFDFKWLLFLLLPILVVTAKLTHHAGFDTYLLVPLGGMGFFLASFFSSQKFLKRHSVLLTGILAVFSILTFRQVQKWTSDESLFEQAYQSEGTLFATTGYAKLLLDQKRFEKAAQLIEVIQQKDLANRELPLLKGRLLFLLDRAPEEKRKLFEQNEMPQAWYQYYFAAFEASQGKYLQAHQRISKSWRHDPEGFKAAFSGNEATLISNWSRICQSAQGADCNVIREFVQSTPDPH